jgi:hypothetical protein
MTQLHSLETFVIVGASLPGAKAAETLRAAGFDGRLGVRPRRTDHDVPLEDLAAAVEAGAA